jgi:hypothetical protein
MIVMSYKMFAPILARVRSTQLLTHRMSLVGNVFMYYMFYSMVSVSNSFVFHNNPLKQILVSRAIVSSVTEHFEMDLMDQTVVFQQLIGNTNYQYAFFYIFGVLLLNYRNHYIMNQIGQGDSHPVGRILFTPLSDKKFENFEYYKKTKKYMKQFLFIIFCIFGRNVCNVY